MSIVMKSTCGVPVILPFIKGLQSALSDANSQHPSRSHEAKALADRGKLTVDFIGGASFCSFRSLGCLPAIMLSIPVPLFLAGAWYTALFLMDLLVTSHIIIACISAGLDSC
jgi:hypothetical protein